jgi:hypothetical protein
MSEFLRDSAQMDREGCVCLEPVGLWVAGRIDGGVCDLGVGAFTLFSRALLSVGFGKTESTAIVSSGLERTEVQSVLQTVGNIRL